MVEGWIILDGLSFFFQRKLPVTILTPSTSHPKTEKSWRMAGPKHYVENPLGGFNVVFLGNDSLVPSLTFFQRSCSYWSDCHVQC